MSTPSQPAPAPSDIGILILDDDEQGQTALWHVLDSEGWRVRVVPLAQDALAELARGNYTLVLVNVAMTGLSGPLFSTLKDLMQSSPEAGKPRVRVLFVVPQLVAEHAQPLFEREGLPYVLKPFHLHDLLEKVSDLLMEARAIPKPIRRVKAETHADRRRKDRRTGDDRRRSMFAARDDYFMTEEEIAEFEKQEAEQNKKKQPKK